MEVWASSTRLVIPVVYCKSALPVSDWLDQLYAGSLDLQCLTGVCLNGVLWFETLGLRDVRCYIGTTKAIDLRLINFISQDVRGRSRRLKFKVASIRL